MKNLILKLVLLLWILFWPAISHAQIAFDAATNGGNSNPGTSLTFSLTVGSGSNRLLFVAITGDAGSGNDFITGVTYAGVSMTRIDGLYQNNGTGSASWVYTYYLLAPATGANNVVVSASSSQTIIACAASYTGVAQSGQPTAHTTNLSAPFTVPLTTSLTTPDDNSWTILGSWGYSSNNPPVAGTGATRRAYDASFGAAGLFDSGAAITPAGSYSMTTDYGGGGSWAISHLMASFKPFTSGGTAPHGLSTSGAGR